MSPQRMDSYRHLRLAFDGIGWRKAEDPGIRGLPLFPGATLASAPDMALAWR